MRSTLNRRSLLAAVTTVPAAAALGSREAAAQEPKSADNPLQPFERLVGGFWHLEGGKPLNAYQQIEWGANKRSLVFRSFVIADSPEKDTIRAEGAIVWHPGKKIAVMRTAGAGGELYEGEWNTSGDTWRQEFTFHTAKGVTPFVETWKFPDADTYVWTLFQKTDAGEKQAIQATFRRKSTRR